MGTPLPWLPLAMRLRRALWCPVCLGRGLRTASMSAEVVELRCPCGARFWVEPEATALVLRDRADDVVAGMPERIRSTMAGMGWPLYGPDELCFTIIDQFAASTVRTHGLRMLDEIERLKARGIWDRDVERIVAQTAEPREGMQRDVAAITKTGQA